MREESQAVIRSLCAPPPVDPREFDLRVRSLALEEKKLEASLIAQKQVFDLQMATIWAQSEAEQARASAAQEQLKVLTETVYKALAEFRK